MDDRFAIAYYWRETWTRSARFSTAFV